ncbi:MAG: hypothetical protein HKN92_09225 [Chitinophagales bacterium]|nr:hypothetical protein [Chitinophagales bacterium]
MKTESTLDANESLRLIAETIQNTKSDVRQNSFYFLLWGWLVAAASLIHYCLLKFSSFEHHYIAWPIMMTLGVIITMVHGYRSSKKNPSESYINFFMKHLWIVIGSSFILMIFICIKLNIHPTPFSLMLAGIGTLISGLTMKYRPFILGGSIFLISAVVAVFLNGMDQLLLNAVAIVLGYLVPAYILKGEKE